MKRKAKNILISLLFFVIIAVAIAFYFFNKGPLNVQDSSAVQVSAIELYKQLSNDSSLALKTYAGKILEVTGKVNSVSQNQRKQQVIILDAMAETGYINCTMEKNASAIKISDQVTLKGICSGIGQGDADLGIKGDVYLTRCYLK